MARHRADAARSIGLHLPDADRGPPRTALAAVAGGAHRLAELFTLSVVACSIGIAYGAAARFSVSFALGAFFAGTVMRESEFSHRAARESLPLRDAFSVLFFVSVGMLLDPSIVFEQPAHVLGVVAIIILGKSVAALALALFFRYPLNTALTVAASLAQIGEFSFILAGLGLSLGLLPAEGMSLVLAGALISIALNPLLFAAIARSGAGCSNARHWRAAWSSATTLTPNCPRRPSTSTFRDRSCRWVLDVSGAASPAPWRRAAFLTWWPSRTANWWRICASREGRRFRQRGRSGGVRRSLPRV